MVVMGCRDHGRGGPHAHMVIAGVTPGTLTAGMRETRLVRI
jgi:hypothetical protein